jgi:hypothetical protein
MMSDTKALEQMLCRFPDGVTINDVDEFYSTWMEPAQAELEQLVSGLAQAKLTCQSYYDCQIKDRETIAKLQAALDEARNVIEIIDNLHPDFPVITAFLKAHHPKEIADTMVTCQKCGLYHSIYRTECPPF